MRICVVHQYYLMPGQSGGSRFNEMCRLWSQAGHEVTVICGTVDYITGQSPRRYRRRWIVEEQDGAVRVLRCHTPTSYAKGTLGRMWAFLGFTLSALSATFRLRRPDVVIATSPPLLAVIPGCFAAWLHGRRTPWVFEMRDLWPESAVTTGVLRADSLLTKLLYRLERWAARRANAINVLTPAFREDLLRRGLAESDKIWFVPNGADLESFAPGPVDREIREQFGWGDRFVVMYAGAHGRANAVGQLIEAAELLKEQPEILIATVGDGPESAQLREAIAQRGLSNIVLHGAQPKPLMPRIVRAADVGAAVLQRNDTFKTVYPNKVFDYMACARPVLLAIDGVARQLVCEEAQAGLFAEPENAHELAAAIRALADDPARRAAMGANGRRYVEANFMRERLATRYAMELQALVERPAPAHSSLPVRRAF